MKVKVYIAVLLNTIVLTSVGQEITSYVDPLIGSGGHGHVFVGANVPFGGVQLGPDNFYKGWDWCSGYNYQDSVIRGFAHTHLSGTGIGDLSDVLIMPYTGAIKTDKGKESEPGSGYSSLFSHHNEYVKPGYYRVKLDNGVSVELTASERVGYHRYRFPDEQTARIIIDLKEGINDRSTDTYLEQIDEYTFVGHRASSGWAKKQLVYFAIKSTVPVRDFSLYDDQAPLSGNKAKGSAIKGLISFLKPPTLVELKVGISPVSTANALANISAEIPHWDFERVAQEADQKWEKELAKIKITTANESEKRIFYTAMYHAMMHPSLFNDHNGDYRGTDGKVYANPGFINYSIFSTWDTYRAAHPLYILLNPDRVNDFVNSMLAISDQQGHLPIWHLMGYETKTMVGVSSQQIVAEAYLKGLRGFDAEHAFKALKKTAMSDQKGLNFLRGFKPIPSDADVGRPVANAMENAIGAGSIALMAKALGNDEDYEYFKNRSQNYKLYYDTTVGFMRGRLVDGSWNPTFDPLKSVRPWAADYAEGNAWQYLWLAPQDVSGLMELLGGAQVFTDRLDTFFSLESEVTDEVLVDLTGTIGQYAHGNEPSHHISYLYAYAGQQWKTAEKAHYIMKEMYHDKPDGIIGNEDCGQMSAWYIFSSLGFYPVFPASCQYVLGSPLFEEAQIELPGGKVFQVLANNVSDANKYIQAARLNGKALKAPFLSHDDIVNGGILELEMADQPNKSWGIIDGSPVSY